MITRLFLAEQGDRSMTWRGLKLAIITLASFWSLSCVSTSNKQLCLKDDMGNSPCRPFRAGIIKMNPELDSTKPLAALDETGWVVNKDQLIGSPEPEWLVSVEIESERLIWQHKLASPPVSPVTLLDGAIIVGLRNGIVRKVNARNGDQIWQQDLGKFVSRRPVLYDGKLFVVTVQQKVFCLDFASGKTLWIYDAGQPSELVIDGSSAPIVLGSQLIMGTNDGNLHAINISDGKKAWVFDPGSKEFRFRDIIGHLAIFEGAIIVTRYDGLVYSLSTQGNRRILWQKKFTNLTASQTREGITYVSGLNGELAALDARSGNVIWQTQVGQAARSITPGDKVVYLGGTAGRITALDTKKGEILWHDDIGGATTQSPVLFGDTLYFGTGYKVLYGYKIL